MYSETEGVQSSSVGVDGQTEFSDPLVTTLARFVRSVGIEVNATDVPVLASFPGLDIEFGAVLIDESRLIHPGNILHEAGHIAMTDPAVRMQRKLFPTGGEEIATLAWSYAAALYLGLGPELVIYPGSYQGWDTALLSTFAEGRYVGVPLLQRYGMAFEPNRAVALGVEPFPHILKWLR